MQITELLKKWLKTELNVHIHLSPLFLIQCPIKYGLQYLRMVIRSLLSHVFYKQNSSKSFLTDHIFCLFLLLYLHLFPNGPSMY